MKYRLLKYTKLTPRLFATSRTKLLQYNYMLASKFCFHTSLKVIERTVSYTRVLVRLHVVRDFSMSNKSLMKDYIVTEYSHMRI